MKRVFLVYVTVLILGFLAIPGFYLEEQWSGKSDWRRYEAEAKQRGVKFDFADFIPPNIPDAENFASIPIFVAVFRASDQGQEIPNPFQLKKPDGIELPKLDVPFQQETIDLVAWQKYFFEMGLLPAAGADPTDDVLRAVDTFAAPLAQVREAGRRPHCHFPAHWEKGPATPLPQYGLFLDIARLHALRLAVHLAHGKSAEAYEDFLDGLQLSRAAAEEPSLIASLVRTTVFVTMANAVWGGLATHRWKEPELRKIEVELGKIDALKDFEFSMSSERAATNVFLDMVLRDKTSLSGLDGRKDGKKNGLFLIPDGWIYANKLRTNQFFDELLARVDAHERRWHSERPTPSAPSLLVGSPKRFKYFIHGILTPVFEGVERKFLQAATLAEQARLACALERYRMAHGQVPPALDRLSPEFIVPMPIEILNGEPYHYRRIDDDNFVLYSVGMNLHDDGGTLDPKLKAGQQLDWVWRYPAK